MVLGGLLCDILFVALTRWLLRWSQQFILGLSCFAVFASNAILGILLFVLPVVLLFPSSPPRFAVEAIELIGCTNALAPLISLLLVFVAGLLLLHRMAWPTAARLLYVVVPSRAQKALLVMVGTALLTVALGKPLSDELTEVLKGLSSGG